MGEAHKPQQIRDEEAEAERVGAYLAEHPDFFEHRPALLESLTIPHASGGAVSLIERQVTRLKQRNRHLQKRLAVLVDTAKENEARVLRLNRLARRLIEGRSLADLVAGLQQSMREDFGVGASLVGLRAQALAGAQPERVPGIRLLEDDADLPAALNDLFRTGRCECGPLGDELRGYLFPDGDEALRSVALVPLERGAALGVLVLASAEHEQFRPDMGAWFLEQLANLVAGAVKARLGGAPDGRG